MHRKNTLYSQMVDWRSAHTDICGKRRICFHFLLLPLRLPPPPTNPHTHMYTRVKTKLYKIYLSDRFWQQETKYMTLAKMQQDMPNSITNFIVDSL